LISYCYIYNFRSLLFHKYKYHLKFLLLMELSFEQLKFYEKEDIVEVRFLNIFYFNIEKKALLKIGKYNVNENSITFDNPNPEKKFNMLIDNGLNNLTNKISGNKAVYIHSFSGIPIIGANSFGLVDRDTNLIELKPITSCNLNCTFCSVDEGKDTKKKLDFVVEKDYLLTEFKKLASFKDVKPLYAYINVHGEPMLYEPLIELISDLKKVENAIVGLITNGTFLSESVIDKLSDAGLDRINISLCAIDKDIAKKLANAPFNVNRLLEMITYANKKLEVVIAPVYLHGINDNEIPKILDFAKSIKNEKGFPLVGIQNFLHYKLGRNPVKEYSFEKFNEKLKQWDANLKDDFYHIFPSKKLPKPFRKDDVVEAEVVCNDRYKNQCIAKASNRVITIFSDVSIGKKVKVKILKDKHNIFVGKIV
jgi:uncharacterized protein